MTAPTRLWLTLAVATVVGTLPFLRDYLDYQPVVARPVVTAAAEPLRPPPSCEAFVGDTPRSSLRGPLLDSLEGAERAAYLTLGSTPTFCSAHTGVADLVPDTVKAFRVLMHSGRAAEAFGSLIDRATLPGQLYALSGLYLVDPDAFERYLPRYQRMTVAVMVVAGCTIGPRRVGDVVGHRQGAGNIASGHHPRSFAGEPRGVEP